MNSERLKCPEASDKTKTSANLLLSLSKDELEVMPRKRGKTHDPL